MIPLSERLWNLALSTNLWCLIILLFATGAALTFDRDPLLAAIHALLAGAVAAGMMLPRPNAATGT